MLDRTNFYAIQNRETKDLIFIKELCVNNKEKDIIKYKKIYKEIYFFIKLKKYKYFSKNVEFHLSENKNYAFLITRGTLSLIISKKFDYSKKKELIKRIIYQITFGLFILHSNNIIHHDIKPSNIVINEDWKISIIDFGSAIFKDEKSYNYTLSYSGLEFLINYNQNVDEKFDMWGLGVIILELYLKENNILNKKV